MPNTKIDFKNLPELYITWYIEGVSVDIQLVW